MRKNSVWLATFAIITFCLHDSSAQGIRLVRSSQSNLDFFVSNKGVVFNHDAIAGLNWPRGTSNSYIFGGGIWFAAKKYFPLENGDANPWTDLGSESDSLVSISGNTKTRDIYVSTIRSLNGLPLGLHKRSDTSDTWTDVPVHARFTSRVNTPLPNGQQLVGADSGLFASTSGGAWMAMVKAPRGTVEYFTALSKFGAAVSSHRQNSVTTQTLYVPNQNLSQWTLRYTFQIKENILFLTSLPGNSVIVAAHASRIWMSKDSGVTWDSTSAPGLSAITGVAISPLDTSLLTATATEGVFHTSNLGKTWTSYSDGIADLHTTALASSDGVNFALGTKTGIFTLNYSPSLKHSWINKSAGIPAIVSVRVLDIDAGGDLHVILDNARIYTTWRSKEFVPGLSTVCELGYNPDNGGGWFSPGESNSYKDGSDLSGRYYPYVGTKFDHETGLPKVQDSVTPSVRWPVWSSTIGRDSVKRNFNFGRWVSRPEERDSVANLGYKPVFISQEDILNSYTDFDTTANPEFVSGGGYPLGLNIQESIFSWGYSPYKDFIFVRYKIGNASNDTLRECYIAPAIDPDLGPGGTASSNSNSYFGLLHQDSVDCANNFTVSSIFHENPSMLKLGRQWSGQNFSATPPGIYGCLGVAFVETPVTINNQLIANDDSISLGGYGAKSKYFSNRLGLSSFRQWTISNDPQNTSQRYTFVASGRKDYVPSIVADMRMILSTGPFTLLPHATVTTTVAIAIARPSTTVLKYNQDSLLRLIGFAHDFFAHSVENNNDADAITIKHFEGALTESIPEQAKNIPETLQISPNPCHDYFTIRRSSSTVASFELFDVLGRVVIPKTNIEGRLEEVVSIHSIPAGLYILQLQTCGAASSRAILIE